MAMITFDRAALTAPMKYDTAKEHITTRHSILGPAGEAWLFVLLMLLGAVFSLYLIRQSSDVLLLFIVIPMTVAFELAFYIAIVRIARIPIRRRLALERYQARTFAENNEMAFTENDLGLVTNYRIGTLFRVGGYTKATFSLSRNVNERLVEVGCYDYTYSDVINAQRDLPSMWYVAVDLGTVVPNIVLTDDRIRTFEPLYEAADTLAVRVTGNPHLVAYTPNDGGVDVNRILSTETIQQIQKLGGQFDVEIKGQYVYFYVRERFILSEERIALIERMVNEIVPALLIDAAGYRRSEHEPVIVSPSARLSVRARSKLKGVLYSQRITVIITLVILLVAAFGALVTYLTGSIILRMISL